MTVKFVEDIFKKQDINALREMIENEEDLSYINFTQNLFDTYITEEDLNMEFIELLLKNITLFKSAQLLVMVTQNNVLDKIIKQHLGINDSPIIKAIMFLEKEKIKEYLAQSPDVNVSVGNNVLLISAALMFGNVEIVKFLIEQGADVNVFVGNNTPLIATAIIFGNAELVKILIETGADIDFKIIDIAIIYGDSEIIKLLIEASNIDINTLFSQTIPSISIAILLGKEDIFKIFIDAGIDSYSGARDIEDYLLLNPADIPKKALKEYRELLKKTNLELDNTMNIIENTKRSVETLLLTVDLKLQSQPDNIQTIIKKEQYLSVRENIFNNLSLYKKKMKFMGQIMQGMQEIINDYDLKSSFHILEKYYALDSMHLIYAVKCGHSV